IRLEQIESEGYSDDDNKEGGEQARKKLSHKESEPQKMPLRVYAGKYWNPGYHCMTVQIQDGKIYIDATDRSLGVTLTFDHVCEQTKYIAHLSDKFEGGDIPFRAEFRLENDGAIRIGLLAKDSFNGNLLQDGNRDDTNALSLNILN
ncbi:Penicillin-binding protein 4, partial [Tolypocladium paradoxum]